MSFKRAFETLARASASEPDRRRWRRVALSLSARMLDSVGREVSCRTLDVSAGGAQIAFALRTAPKGPAVVYIDGLGRFDCVILRATTERAAIRFEASEHKRERAIEELTWRLNEHALGLVSERRSPRVSAEAGPFTVAEIETGETIAVRILDASIVGMAVECVGEPPPLGAWVRIGLSWGCVARRYPGGFAVDFTTPRQGAPG